MSTFSYVLDSLAILLNDRFSEECLTVIKAMKHFTHIGLLDIANQGKEVKLEEIDDLGVFYGLQTHNTAEELKEFQNFTS